MVPCNPEEYLSFQYGKDKWKKRLIRDYFNHNSISFYKYWSDDEWPHVVRWYNFRTGELDFYRTILAINEHAKTHLKTLPNGTY